MTMCGATKSVAPVSKNDWVHKIHLSNQTTGMGRAVLSFSIKKPRRNWAVASGAFKVLV